ncbi:transcriptional regulator [Acinetobacter gandensis]|uniref:Transcriptional regulator n=1 Tax=Acinetobacter gandensis TaxID=1443941 RepID=A0A1A7RFH3_9GAMM|nr:ATP-binding protein [Acinetobacter gandensis]KAB0622355.1 transcriptional regulator [Acinetobacter gandensis]OBX29422.1 transcriptional regulator [Acinetobacter gandensis]
MSHPNSVLSEESQVDFLDYLLQFEECEWIEFKFNALRPDELGQYISALSNAAALDYKKSAYMIFGIRDKTKELIGTNFKPFKDKHNGEDNGQELSYWLLQKLKPHIDFTFYELERDGFRVVVVEIKACEYIPIAFDKVEYLRVGSNKRPLSAYPEKSRKLWGILSQAQFEEQTALDHLKTNEVLNYLDTTKYYELVGRPVPVDDSIVLSDFHSEHLIQRNQFGGWLITNMGALLFAKDLTIFPHLERKIVRLIVYKGKDKFSSPVEYSGKKGYAVGFEGLIDYIHRILPDNEEIGKALRKNVPVYPALSIRELIANALIHQDFSIKGTGPTIEIFQNRMEITNPGIPLIDIDRFLDSPPKSRNEKMASLLRRMGICEERGSGIDKVVKETELYQLPAPSFKTYEEHIKCIMFSFKEFKNMDIDEKVEATYFHSVLRYLSGEPMNNSTLRERFGIKPSSGATVSRIIKKAVEKKRIKPVDPSAGTKNMKYLPWWA